MKNHLNKRDSDSLHELLSQAMLTPFSLAPLQAQYIAQKINLFDHEEDIMCTLLKINGAMDHMAECTKLAMPDDLRAALVADIKLMAALFNLLHAFKARPFIMG